MANLSDYIFTRGKEHAGVRLCWFFVYFLIITVTTVLVVTLWNEFLTNPIITTLDDRDYPVEKIPFPGIGICNMNKISRKKALVFGKEMFKFSRNPQLNESEMLKTVSIFGKLLDFDYNSDDGVAIKQVERMLKKLQPDLLTVMKKLAPDCNDLLVVCKWKGISVNCSEIFQMRLTYTGYCCTFNYVKKTKNSNSTTNSEPLQGEDGIDTGLSVFVNNEIDDYLYAPLSSQGVTVLVFGPKDYPDMPSGSLTEVIANVDTESFLEIIPTTVVAVEEVRKHPLSKRQCLFDEERMTKFDGEYSQSDCNVDCRVASTLALCGCVPFMIPLSNKDNVCTLSDLHCLNRYKSNFGGTFGLIIGMSMVSVIECVVFASQYLAKKVHA